jgi:hypothetical protein
MTDQDYTQELYDMAVRANEAYKKGEDPTIKEMMALFGGVNARELGWEFYKLDEDPFTGETKETPLD